MVIFIHVLLQEAAKMVQPSSRREGFSAIPNVKWEDVGGLSLLRTEFDRYIVKRIKHPEYYEVLIYISFFIATESSVFTFLSLPLYFVLNFLNRSVKKKMELDFIFRSRSVT